MHAIGALIQRRKRMLSILGKLLAIVFESSSSLSLALSLRAQVGDAELTLSPDGAPNVLQRLWTARCVEDPPKGGATASTNGPSGCRLLAVRRELFSHLTDVFEPLENGLATRAQVRDFALVWYP